MEHNTHSQCTHTHTPTYISICNEERLSLTTRFPIALNTVIDGIRLKAKCNFVIASFNIEGWLGCRLLLCCCLSRGFYVNDGFDKNKWDFYVVVFKRSGGVEPHLNKITVCLFMTLWKAVNLFYYNGKSVWGKR